MSDKAFSPKADRPSIAAGYLTPKLLAWAWAEGRLIRSRNYWIATVTEAGHPHARPVWGVWLDRMFYFSSGSRIRANILRQPEVSMNLESGNECVILEGVATEVRSLNVARRVARAYNEKYSWDAKAQPGEFFLVKPRVVFGWLCDPSGEDGGALFSQTATRWKFRSGRPLSG